MSQEPSTTPVVQPITTLTSRETRSILSNPHGLRLLMDNEDIDYSESVAIAEPGECGPWPTPRYVALREMGRAIIKEDPELWDEAIRRGFGFEVPAANPAHPGA